MALKAGIVQGKVISCDSVLLQGSSIAVPLLANRMAYPKLSPSASGADRGIFPVKSLLDFKDYRSCVSAPTSPTAQRMLVGSSRAPMDPLSPRRQSCSSEYMSTPDVVGVRERRSHSLFETLDTNTILSARLRNLHIDLVRLLAVHAV